MQSKKRFISLVALLTIVTLMLVACGGGQAPAVEEEEEPVAEEEAAEEEEAEEEEEMEEEEAAEEEELPGLVIGELAPMTGFGAGFGESQNNGVELAVAEINEAGGIPGIGEITIVLGDTTSDATAAVNAANKLIQQDEVDIILGALLSGNTLAVVPVTEREEIPQVTALSSAPTITDQGSEWIFRVQITAARSASALARYFNDSDDFNAVAVINDTNEFGTNFADVIEATLEDEGSPLVARETYVTGDRDFTAQLLSIKNAEATGVIISGHFAEAALIMQQMRELGMEVQVGGPDAVADTHIFDLIDADLIDGFIFSNSYASTLPDPRIQEYAARYEDTYGIPSNNGDALSYDVVYIIAAAAERAGSTDKAALRDALRETDYDGISGHITFDENGDAQRDPYIIEWHGDATTDILKESS
jgi:branched-chain amino acid transport system substrate-binding protein